MRGKKKERMVKVSEGNEERRMKSRSSEAEAEFI